MLERREVSSEYGRLYREVRSMVGADLGVWDLEDGGGGAFGCDIVVDCFSIF